MASVRRRSCDCLRAPVMSGIDLIVVVAEADVENRWNWVPLCIRRVDVCVLIESEEAEQVSDLIKTFRLADEGFHNV
jgi:hypothetical protein